MAAKREDLRVGRAGLLNRRTDEAGSREYVALYVSLPRFPKKGRRDYQLRSTSGLAIAVYVKHLLRT